MYQVSAVFNKQCLTDMLDELHEKGIEGLTVSDVAGRDSFAPSEQNRLSDPDEKVKELVMDNAHDPGHGAGKMWVTPVLEVERIRTGEKDAAAHKLHESDYFTHEDTPSSRRGRRNTA